MTHGKAKVTAMLLVGVLVSTGCMAGQKSEARAQTLSAAVAAEAKLMADVHKRQMGPHPPIKAHVLADGVRVEPLSVPSLFGPLRGALTLPAGAGPFPTVLLVPGAGPSDLDETIGPNHVFRDMANGLAKAGVATLRYDKRTFDYPLKVAANPVFNVDDEYTHDVLAALKLLSKHKSVDPHRVFVLGLGQGAVLTPRFAKRAPALAGVIMLAAMGRRGLTVAADETRALLQRVGASKTHIAAVMQNYKDMQARLDKLDPAHPPKGKFGSMPIAYMLSLYDYHQVDVAKTLTLPMLVLQGGSDFQTSPSKDFEAWKKALAGRSNVSFHLYPSLSYLFRQAGKTGTVADYLKPGPTDPAVIDDIAAWVKSQPAHH